RAKSAPRRRKDACRRRSSPPGNLSLAPGARPSGASDLAKSRGHDPGWVPLTLHCTREAPACYSAGMRIIGLAGWSGSGKTTLLTRAIPRLVARGLTVSTLKHAHHNFDVDQPGKDSHAHRVAGATEVLIGSERRWALM